MLDPEALALELLEFKTRALRAGEPHGASGIRAWELYGYLLESSNRLDDAQRRQLERLGEALRDHAPAASRVEPVTTFEALTLPTDVGDMGSDNGETNAASAPAGLDGAALPFGSADEAVEEDFDALLAADPAPTTGTDGGGKARRVDSAAIEQERDILKRLARRVWWDDIEAFVERIAASWRAERDRSTARLIYATLQNLGRNRERDSFVQDVNLRGFKIVLPIPDRSDPLVSFNDLESLAEIVREVINLISTVGRSTSTFGDLNIREEQALEYVRDAALRVARDPYAGAISPLPRQGPSAGQLRLAIQELAKERLPDVQRRRQRNELERRLAETVAWKRNQRQLLQRDVARFSELVNSFFDRLAKYLPTSVGGEASGPRLLGGVLFGAHPALRVDSVPETAEAITVRLLGPTRFELQGTEIGISGSGNQRLVFIGGDSETVAPRFEMAAGDRRLMLFYESDYLHVKFRGGGRSLATLVAEALTVHYVESSERSNDLSTLLKVVANAVQGETETLVAQAIERAAAVSRRAPERRPAIEGLLRGAARAADLSLPDGLLLGLVQRFHTAMTVRPADLAGLIERSPGEAAVYAFSGEPLNVEIASLRITVRQYRDGGGGARSNLVAMMPGRVLGSFNEYLIEDVPGGALIFVRGEQEVAVLHIDRKETVAGA